MSTSAVTHVLKCTLGVRKQTPAICGDTRRFPLIIRQHIKTVKYWCRILKLSQSHPVRNAYNMLLNSFQTEPEITRVIYDVIKSKHLKNVPSTETCGASSQLSVLSTIQDGTFSTYTESAVLNELSWMALASRIGVPVCMRVLERTGLDQPWE